MPQIYYNDTPLSQMPSSYPASRVTHESVSVTADGVKTYRQLLNELFALVDFSKLNGRSFVVWENTTTDIYPLQMIESTYFYASMFVIQGDGTLSQYSLRVESANSYIIRLRGGTTKNYSTDTATNGEVITLYYD